MQRAKFGHGLRPIQLLASVGDKAKGKKSLRQSYGRKRPINRLKYTQKILSNDPRDNQQQYYHRFQTVTTANVEAVNTLSFSNSNRGSL